MAFIRSEEEANQLIEEMKAKTKGKYITQGVSFNKESTRQMELLKYALMSSSAFSGLIKELLATRMDGLYYGSLPAQQVAAHAPIEKRDVSNFMLDD